MKPTVLVQPLEGADGAMAVNLEEAVLTLAFSHEPSLRLDYVGSTSNHKFITTSKDRMILGAIIIPDHETYSKLFRCDER